MKAMILAAGIGSRLRPLTDSTPKALVPFAGTTLLEYQIRRLKSAGVTGIIINAHHFADQIIEFLSKHDFGIRIEVSLESELLDTGGGVRKAAWFFDDGQDFMVHNVDVLTDLNYQILFEQHQKTGALATLAVRKRESSRYFLFDSEMQLAGWQNNQTGETILVRTPAQGFNLFSFMGIHVLSPKIFSLMPEKDAFSIVDFYLDLADKSMAVIGVDCFHCAWQDVGKPEQLYEAEKEKRFRL